MNQRKKIKIKKFGARLHKPIDTRIVGHGESIIKRRVHVGQPVNTSPTLMDFVNTCPLPERQRLKAEIVKFEAGLRAMEHGNPNPPKFLRMHSVFYEEVLHRLNNPSALPKLAKFSRGFAISIPTHFVGAYAADHCHEWASWFVELLEKLGETGG